MKELHKITLEGEKGIFYNDIMYQKLNRVYVFAEEVLEITLNEKFVISAIVCHLLYNKT